MIRVGRSVEICQVTSYAGIGGIDIATLVAGKAIICNGRMCPGQRVNIVVIKVGWSPCRLRMTGFAGCGEIGGNVVRIGRLVIFISMANKACPRQIGIISVMTGGTIIGNGNVCTGQYIVIIVDREGGRFPARLRCMTGFAGGWYVDGNMVRIGRIAVVSCMTGETISRRSGKTMGMAFQAIGCKMGACKWKYRGTVVKGSFGGSGWMACITGRAVIGISLCFTMFIVHFRLIVIMAVNAGVF